MRNETIEKMKKDIANTNIQEMKVQNQVYQQHCQKLSVIIEQIEKSDKEIERKELRKLIKEKYEKRVMKHFNDQLDGIIHENDTLKKKVEKQKVEYQTLSRKYES